MVKTEGLTFSELQMHFFEEALFQIKNHKKNFIFYCLKPINLNC